jgi:hypothetical protein
VNRRLRPADTTEHRHAPDRKIVPAPFSRQLHMPSPSVVPSAAEGPSFKQAFRSKRGGSAALGTMAMPLAAFITQMYIT